MPLPNYDKNLDFLKSNLKDMQKIYDALEAEIFFLPDYLKGESRYAIFIFLKKTLKIEIDIIERSIRDYQQSNVEYEKLQNNTEEKAQEISFDSSLMSACEKAIRSFKENENIIRGDIADLKKRVEESNQNKRDCLVTLSKENVQLREMIKIYEKREEDLLRKQRGGVKLFK